MDELLSILTELHPDVDFAAEENMVEEGILDSFDIVSILSEVYERFSVTIPPEEILPENFASCKTLWALITRLMEED